MIEVKIYCNNEYLYDFKISHGKNGGGKKAHELKNSIIDVLDNYELDGYCYQNAGIIGEDI
jgi:hypothetical protein